MIFFQDFEVGFESDFIMVWKIENRTHIFIFEKQRLISVFMLLSL